MTTPPRKPWLIVVHNHGRSCWGWALTRPDHSVIASCAHTRHAAITEALKLVPEGAAFEVTANGRLFDSTKYGDRK